MSLAEILQEAARDRNSSRAPDFDEYVRRLGEAEDGLEDGDETAGAVFLEWLREIGLSLLPPTGRSAWTAQERAWMAEPRRSHPRPPILF